MSTIKELTPRLAAVTGQVPECERCADIGCDHAQAAIWLVRRGIVAHMTAADVNRGPLERARAAVKRAGLDGRISCVLTDGLDGIPPQDAVIIAGMGGDLIADILSRAPWTRQPGRTLILQPMTAAYRLREFLFENGYNIEAETYAREREKLYVILTARAGGYAPADMSELYLSRAGEAHPLAGEYARRVISKLTCELRGLRRAEHADQAALLHREAAIELLKRRF